MKIIGKFNSGEFFGDECKINFRVEDSGEVHKYIYGYLTSGLFITFGESVQFKGRLEGESSQKRSMTMFIVLTIEADKMSRLFSFRSQSISIDVEKDPNSSVTSSIANIAYITKLKGMMNIIGSHVGYTDVEMQKIIIHGFIGAAELTTFDLKRAKEGELPLLEEYIIKQGLVVGIDLSSPIEDSIPSLDDNLRMRRKMKKCCVCSKASVLEEGIYPLCNKHLIEFRNARTAHPKVWEANFRKRLGER